MTQIPPDNAGSLDRISGFLPWRRWVERSLSDLSDRIAALGGRTSGGGWTTLTHIGTGVLRYQTRNGTVYVEGSLTLVLATATPVVLNPTDPLPPDVSPSLALNMGIGWVNVGDRQGIVSAYTDGTIAVEQHTGGAAASIQFRYSYPQG